MRLNSDMEDTWFKKFSEHLETLIKINKQSEMRMIIGELNDKISKRIVKDDAGTRHRKPGMKAETP